MEYKFVLGKTWGDFKDEVEANKRRAKERNAERKREKRYWLLIAMSISIPALVISGFTVWVVFKLFS